MNTMTMELRKTPMNVSNKKIFGIHMSRFGASWLNAGGRFNDRDGFILWMMNIPFKNDDGTIEYISQDDAEDAYWMMTCGKMELEHDVCRFRKEHGVNERGYVNFDESVY